MIDAVRCCTSATNTAVIIVLLRLAQGCRVSVSCHNTMSSMYMYIYMYMTYVPVYVGCRMCVCVCYQARLAQWSHTARRARTPAMRRTQYLTGSGRYCSLTSSRATPYMAPINCAFQLYVSTISNILNRLSWCGYCKMLLGITGYFFYCYIAQIYLSLRHAIVTGTGNGRRGSDLLAADWSGRSEPGAGRSAAQH